MSNAFLKGQSGSSDWTYDYLCADSHASFTMTLNPKRYDYYIQTMLCRLSSPETPPHYNQPYMSHAVINNTLTDFKLFVSLYLNPPTYNPATYVLTTASQGAGGYDFYIGTAIVGIPK